MSPLYFNAESGQLREVPRDESGIPSDTDGWRPLAELLVAQEFPYTRGDFSRPNTQRWDDAYIRRLWLLVSQDLAELDPPKSINKPVIDRLNVLGVFPSLAYFGSPRKHYNGITDFRKQIETEDIPQTNYNQRNREYRGLSLESFTSLILSRYNDLLDQLGQKSDKPYDGPITQALVHTMNRMNLAPSAMYILKTYGGLTQLNEYLGFPNIRNWDEIDYIEYGVRIIKENGPKALTATNINLLSTRQLGPNKNTIAKYFGNLSVFQNLAMAEYARQEELREARSVAIERHFANIEYRYAIPDDPDERAKTWGRYLLAQSCLPKATKGELRELSRFHNGNFVERLLERRPDFSLADIEVMAVSLQVADYIWPPVNQRSLKL